VVHDLLNALDQPHDCEDNMTQLKTPHFVFSRFATLLALGLLAGCGASHATLGLEPGNDSGPASGDDGGSDGRNSVTEVTLDPPASAELGWQYEIPAFTVDPGSEVQQCFFFTVPSDVPAFVNHIEIAQTTGTHHMNIFRVRTVKLLDGTNGDVVRDGECWKPTNWSDWPLVINSQNEGHVDFHLPIGVAHKFQAGEKLMLQTHYVNATTQKTPSAGRVLVNFNRIPENQVTAELGTAFATNQNIRVCPGDVGHRFETTCTFARHDVTIFGANGHFHSRGRLFTMSVFNPTGAETAPFYENRDWAEPLFEKNIGAAVPSGGGIRYSCEFTVGTTECGDVNDECCFTFGGKVEFQEHCNAFVYYYPANGTSDVNCF
jgi:hypothetical protein